MAQSVKANHPRSTFCFSVSGKRLGEDVLNRMRVLITTLAETRNWVLGPPRLADEHDGDVRIIGGTLDLYAAIPPFGADLPNDVDRQHLEEVTAIIDALTPLSRETGLEISFMLDQTYVGRIKNGIPDNMIMVGLLGEWKKAHGQS
jgi:hypothetical protein